MKYLRLLAAALALACAATPATSATLTFDGDICAGTCADGDALDQTYGDIAGVLNISHRTVNSLGSTTTSQGFLQYWNSGYGDLINVAWGQPNAGAGGEIRFDGLNGNLVTLTSIQLGGWAADVNTAVRIYDASMTQLYSSGAIGSIVAPDVGGHATDSFFVTGSTLILQWHDPWGVGIDNVTFSVGVAAIPEPSTYALMIAGLGLVGYMARRRRKA